MALVCRQLFGKHPSFLKSKDGKNLYELTTGCEHVGMKVTHTQWTRKNYSECYYTIDSVKTEQDLRSGKATGRLTWFGKERNESIVIEDSTKRSWQIYTSNQEKIALARKVSGASIIE